MALLSSNYYTYPEGSVGNLSSLWSPTTTQTTAAPAPAAPTNTASINPLTGQPYNWSTGSNYGSLDQHLYGYNYTEPYNEYANYGDMGYTPNTTWVPGALEQIANRQTIGSAGDSSTWSGLFEDDIYKMLADQYGNKGYTFGQEEDGRMWRKAVYDSDGNVVWGGTPYYHSPDNPWTEAVLPLAAFALGAPALGQLAGIPIPAGTPTLGGLLGGATSAAESGGTLADMTLNGLEPFSMADAGLGTAEAIGGTGAAGAATDYSLASQFTGTPYGTLSTAPTAEGLAASAVPSGSGLTIPTAAGTVTGSGLIGAGTLPALGEASSIINAGTSVMPGTTLPGAPSSPTVPTPTLPSGVQNLITNPAIKTLLNQLVGGENSVLSNLAGMYSAYQNKNDLSDLENMFTGMYGQDSPYAKALRQQLDRRDAAAGRRSQYGPREVELQAKLADQTSRNAMAISNLRMAAGGQRNALINNGLQGLQSLFNPQGTNSIISTLSGLFKDTNWNEMSPEDVANWQTILDKNPDLYSIPDLDIPIPEIDFGG